MSEPGSASRADGASAARRLLPYLAWALPGAAVLASSGWPGLIEPTETRYAEIAREMLGSGDWLVPRLNGIAHFHKPPLAYWLTASGLGLAGVNSWAAHLGSALAASFLLWATHRIARTLGGDSATVALAPLLLASSVMGFVLTRMLGSDVFLAASVAGFHAAFLPTTSRRGLWPFVALAAGFMAKGPVVLVHTVVPVLLAAAWARDRDAARALRSARGWRLFAALALPWYLVVVARTPGLLEYWLRDQLWQRFATTTHGRPGPPWYFVAVAVAAALPWTWGALAGGWRCVRPREPRRGFEDTLLAVWVLAPLVFFSCSGSKLPAYLLPELPALALLAAGSLKERGRPLRYLTAATLLAMAAALEVYGPRALGRQLGWMGQGFEDLPLAFHLSALAFLIAGLHASVGRPRRAAGLTLGGLLAMLWGASWLFSSELGSPRGLVTLLREQRAAGEPVVEYGRFNAGLPFYLQETVALVDVGRELEFEAPGGAPTVLEPGRLRELVERAPRVWVLAPQARLEALERATGATATVVSRWRGQALVVLQR